MPINDPIRRRKISPASLAFDNGTARRSAQTVSYQQTVVQEATMVDLSGLATTRDVVRGGEIVNDNIIHAEQRSKNYVGQYMQVVEWDIAHDLTITTNSNDPIGFAQPVINCIGAKFSGTISAASAQWSHQVVKGYQGIWWYFVMLQLSLPAAVQGLFANIKFVKNGTVYRIVDAIDAEMSGDRQTIFIEDMVLRGGCHIPMNVGDVITVALYLNNGGPPGDLLLTFPSSVYGYVTGHREQCDTTFLGSTPTTGEEFAFRQ